MYLFSYHGIFLLQYELYACMIFTMKSRKVKTKIAQIIKTCGSRQQAADKLNISLRWLYYLEIGEKIPGWHLYRDICEFDLPRED